MKIMDLMDVWAKNPFNPIEDLGIHKEIINLVTSFLEQAMDYTLEIDRIDQEWNDTANEHDLCFDPDELKALDHTIEILRKQKNEIIR